MISYIIFSKNRACQLDALLRSFSLNYKDYNPRNISVVYTTSNDFFEQGYSTLRQERNALYYREMNNFEALVKDLVHRSSNPLIAFLVDDIIFKEKFSYEDKEIKNLLLNKQILCHSLRLHKEINYCYPINKSVNSPYMDENNSWLWKTAQGDFGYPMSVDGHIFRKEDLQDYINQLSFSNPNTFEGIMAQYSFVLENRTPYLSCYKENSKLINIPANKVQNVVGNRVGNIISVEMLNTYFLEGKKIDIDPFQGYKNSAPHEEISIILK